MASPQIASFRLSSLRHGRGASVWSREEICRLRELAENGTPLRLIARILRRTESAVRNKAGMHGISLCSSGPKAKANGLQPAAATEYCDSSFRVD